MPNDKSEANSEHVEPGKHTPSESLDLAEEKGHSPEAGSDERHLIFSRYWAYNKGLISFLQNEPEIPELIRADARDWGFPKDEFVDNRHRPSHAQTAPRFLSQLRRQNRS